MIQNKKKIYSARYTIIVINFIQQKLSDLLYIISESMKFLMVTTMWVTLKDPTTRSG